MTSARDLTSLDQLEQLRREQPALAVYFHGEHCGVCGALWPKLAPSLTERFPRLAWARIDAEGQRELTAQLQVFTLPVLVVYFDGMEVARFARSFSPAEVANAIERPYRMLFSEEA